jgi:hypothetical protein
LISDKSLFRFGDGYTILVRTNIDVNRGDVIAYIQKSIPGAVVKEEHNKMIHFRVSTNVPLYKMFSVLEKARDELKDFIEDYTITQVTLDDVFVNFAKIQEENPIREQSSFYELIPRRANSVGKFIRSGIYIFSRISVFI